MTDQDAENWTAAFFEAFGPHDPRVHIRSNSRGFIVISVTDNFDKVYSLADEPQQAAREIRGIIGNALL